MEEKLNHFQIEAISEALNSRMHSFEGYSLPVKDESKLHYKVKECIEKYWNIMMKSGRITEVHEKKEQDMKGMEQCIILKSRKTTSLGPMGGAWFILQFLEKIEFRRFLRKNGFTKKETFAALICVIAFAATRSETRSDYIFEFNHYQGLPALTKMVEELAKTERYKGKFQAYQEIITIPMVLLAIREKLEKFFFSIVSRIHLDKECTLNSTTTFFE